MDFSDFLPHMKDKVTWHKTPYPAIDPTRPELSQAGRSVLITGSSGGIGFFVARGFARAGAATVVLTGRDAASLSKAADELGAQYPGTKVVGKTVDIADPASIKSLWHGLEADGLVIDVLILSAASVQYEAATMLELGRERVMSEFAVNVGSNLELADYFYNQKKRDRGSKLVRLLRAVQLGENCPHKLTKMPKKKGSDQHLDNVHPQLRHQQDQAKLCGLEECGDAGDAAGCPGRAPERHAGHQLPPWGHYDAVGAQGGIHQGFDPMGQR